MLVEEREAARRSATQSKLHSDGSCVNGDLTLGLLRLLQNQQQQQEQQDAGQLLRLLKSGNQPALKTSPSFGAGVV